MFIRFILLRDPGAAEGGTGTPSNPPPVGPPAAQTVVTGTKTETEIALESTLQQERQSARDREAQLLTDLEKERNEKKQRETKIAELEDQISGIRWRPFKL